MSMPGKAITLSPRYFFIPLLIFFSFTYKSISAQEALTPNPLAEAWILEKVASGEVADLSEQFRNPSDRVISAEFLENLATGTLTGIPRQGVRIANATIVERLLFENIDIPYELHLESCEFRESVDFSRSHFAQDLNLSHSRFLKPIDFTDSRIDRSLWFDGATFENQANFSLAGVGRVFILQDAVFEGETDFSLLNAGVQVWADGAQLQGAWILLPRNLAAAWS